MPQPNSIASAVTLAAVAISENCSSDEAKLLSAVFTQLADTIATIITADEINEEHRKAD